MQTNRDLGQVLKKIPLFHGLSPSQIRKVLGLSTLESYQPGNNICVGGDESSDEMYVLLAGELAVKTEDGVRVATLKPVTTVGEIGLITRQPRSATVEALQSSRILLIPKTPFEHLLRADRDVQVTIFRNVIEILSTKLSDDNIRMRDHLLDQIRRETRIKEQSRRAEIALDLLLKQGSMTRPEAEAQIADEMEEVSLRILIVDDEPAIRRVVKEALDSFDVVEAGDGKEALQKVQEERPDLVIADIKMPQMDGFTLLTHLRDKYPDLPVLALSGYVDPEEIQQYTFDGFVQKPIQLEEFRKAVEGTLVRDDPDS